MKITSIKELHPKVIEEFFIKHWGSPIMVISSGVYDCTTLDGFVILNHEDQIIGMITYCIRELECEIISLDSLEENKGIGTALLKKAEETVRDLGCTRIVLVTTNDNLHALKFYQKRGYYLVKILRNAVDEARKIKPQIPLIGNDGIPIRDEILLEKIL